MDNGKSGNLNKQDLIQFRIDRDLKIDAEDICNQLGIDLSTVLRMCLKQMVAQKGIPFSVHLSNHSYSDSAKDINYLKSKDIEDNCEKGFGIDIRGINEEVDSIRKENIDDEKGGSIRNGTTVFLLFKGKVELTDISKYRLCCISYR